MYDTINIGQIAEVVKPDQKIDFRNPFQIAPPGWRLRGEAWWLLLSVFGKPEGNPRRSPDLSRTDSETGEYQFGPGHFDPIDQSGREFVNTPGEFRGGTGTVQIIRYHSSPVGPYDELMIVPGKFNVPEELGGGSMSQITCIYVSSLQSVFNGRTHWNVPKKLAHFEFIAEPCGSVTIKVYALESYTFASLKKGSDVCFQPTFASIPFFSTTFHSFGPENLRVPFRTSYLPVCTTIAQPPLREGDLTLGSVGSSTWKKFEVDVSGRVGLRKAEGSLKSSNGSKRFADDEKFPDFKPYQIGIHWKDAIIDIGRPTILSKIKK
ncbi:uncharacterized protein MELLADRAFT_77340 [Melampsora larici-populina 98AG31]|uniref:Uncharacterized protein n=1 Tax=Melampsora larici-populina (strain 98AG31 / pathotype 3-4-7) TaxID=747676 RepID=F4RGL4_MELLP|nr:uncharacterized protein MELLADRAFT_77340 [Melampsora larici-populina 98AG31]EGG08628.1 hypothetical protein MELLADRAFT_77340 [Melampsora larici-populina 98AG31]